jgi:tripartite-type tricarboxylate transporter receptor subunit TctC
MGVPSVFKYVTNEADRKVVELIISQQVFQRSYIAPPGLPAEQLDTLRSAFDATMRDREFLTDAETMRIDISPLPGAKVQELVTNLYAAPKDLVARARQAINP